jgi:hypothetical protein
MKLICKQVINELLGAQVDFGKVQRLVPRDKGFSTSDIRAALAAMNFVLRQATVNAVTHDVLNRELQQLGLPKENSDGISRPFRNNRDLLMGFNAASSLAVSQKPWIRAVCRSRHCPTNQSFRVFAVLQLPRPLTMDWRVDAVLASSETSKSFAAPTASVAMRFGLSHRRHEMQPPPAAKAAVLSNPARHEAERGAERALAAAVAAHPEVAEAAAAVMVPPADAIAGGATAAALPPVCELTMTAEKYLAFSSELRRAAATLEAVFPVAAASGEPGAEGRSRGSSVGLLA